MAGSGYALAVLFAINLMNFFDRQIIGGVGEGIRREWALSDTALGLLGTVFTLLYAVVGLPLGRLSDRKQRRTILAAGVFLWSLLTALSGIASIRPRCRAAWKPAPFTRDATPPGKTGPAGASKACTTRSTVVSWTHSSARERRRS